RPGGCLGHNRGPVGQTWQQQRHNGQGKASGHHPATCCHHAVHLFQYSAGMSTCWPSCSPHGCVFLLGMTCRLCRVDCPDIRSVRVFRSYLALPIVILAGQRLYRQVSAGASGMAWCCRVRWFRGRFRDHGRKPFLTSIGGTAVAVTLSVTVRQVRDDGTEAPVDGELAAALSGPAEQFAGLLTWAADESGFLDHGEREDVIGQE